jgi:hypothetical protein
MRVNLLSRCESCGAEGPGGAPYCVACGLGQPSRPEGDPGAHVDLVDPDVTPPLLPTQPSRVNLVVLVCLVLLLLLVTVPVLAIRSLFFGPDDTVRGYFDALAERDATAAWEQLDPGPVSRGEPLVSVGALADGYDPPAQYRLKKLDVDGDDATAQVTYTLRGAPVSDVVKLHRGRATNLFQRWHLTDGLRPLPVAAPSAGRFKLGGATLDPGDSGDQALQGFIGQYTMTLLPNPLFAADPVTVTSGGAGPATLRLRVAPSAQTAIQQQVKDYVDTCAKSTAATPPNCPFEGNGYDEPVKYQVLSYPTLTLTVSNDGSVGVQTQGSGSVRVTGAPGSYYPPYTDQFSVQGVARLAGGGVRFSPQ